MFYWDQTKQITMKQKFYLSTHSITLLWLKYECYTFPENMGPSVFTNVTFVSAHFV